MKTRTLTTWLVALLTVAICGAGFADDSLIPNELLSSDTVWSAAAEELEWSEVRPAEVDKSWLESDYSDQNFEVVRGVKGTVIDKAIADHILPKIESRLRIDSDWERETAIRRIKHELRRTPIIVDRFEQTFYKSVGDESIEAFTREALLLDVSKENLAKIARPVRREVHHSNHIRRGALTFFVVVITIVCLICWMLYRFFNRITRGYYVWPIRLVTAMILLGSFSMAAGITLTILRAL